MTKIRVIGDGAFGSFLMGLFDSIETVELTDNNTCKIIVLAVPLSAYDEVASQFNNQHLLVNVCSVQEEATDICLNYSENVLGFHPMFGARTPKDMNKICLVTNIPGNTYGSQLADEVIAIFQTINAEIITKTPEGEILTGEWHDRLMAKTHFKALEIAELAAPMLDDIKNIPDKYFPATVTNLKRLVDQLRDMPPGTRESIKSNKYGKL